jgi:hypothetical protein
MPFMPIEILAGARNMPWIKPFQRQARDPFVAISPQDTMAQHASRMAGAGVRE